MITATQYSNIGGTDLSQQAYPLYFKPVPQSDDYKKGYIYRYFVQKINDLTITEVTKDKYNDISEKYYVKFLMQWVLSGPKNNQYKNKILERKGVQEQNTQLLNEGEKKMKGIKNYINNPLEFWQGK